MPDLRVNDIFEKVLVLNLDRRRDRLAAAGAQLRRFGIGFERFPAIDGQRQEIARQWQAYARRPLVRVHAERPVTSYREFYLDYESDRARVAFVEGVHGKKALATLGAWGLLLSMTAIVEEAIEAGWESLLVLEDDILLHRDTRLLFERFVAQAPSDWVVLQLGAMQLHWDTSWITWHSDNLYRCHGSSIGAHAYGIRKEAFALLRERCHRRDLPFDIGALHTVKRRFDDRCFTMVPNLAIQDAADSDIGMSTLFFREARKCDNIYRWHLPDYGLRAAGAEQREAELPAPRAAPARAGGKITDVRRRLSVQLTRIASLLDRSDGGPGASNMAAGTRAGAQRTAAPPWPSGPLAPLQAFPKQRPQARTIAAVIVGLERAEIAPIVDTVDAMGARLNMVPVLITDTDAFELFRNREAVAEYLPPAEQQRLAPELDWDLYRLRRLALLRRKWNPVRIIAFGTSASALLRAWRSSPFEDAGIEAAISAQGRAPEVAAVHD